MKSTYSTYVDPSTYSPAPTTDYKIGGHLEVSCYVGQSGEPSCRGDPWKVHLGGMTCWDFLAAAALNCRRVTCASTCGEQSVWDGRWGLDRCQGDDKCEWCEKRWRHLYRDGFMGGGGTWFKEGATPTWQSLPLVCFMARFSTIPSPVT